MQNSDKNQNQSLELLLDDDEPLKPLEDFELDDSLYDENISSDDILSDTDFLEAISESSDKVQITDIMNLEEILNSDGNSQSELKECSDLSESVNNDVLTTYIIDNKKMLYIEKTFEGFTLCGKILQKDYKLKPLKYMDRPYIKLKFMEQLGISKSRYLVKTENFRAVVDITDEDMQMLMEF